LKNFRFKINQSKKNTIANYSPSSSTSALGGSNITSAGKLEGDKSRLLEKIEEIIQRKKEIRDRERLLEESPHLQLAPITMQPTKLPFSGQVSSIGR
jgi:hypothetical protein